MHEVMRMLVIESMMGLSNPCKACMLTYKHCTNFTLHGWYTCKLYKKMEVCHYMR